MRKRKNQPDPATYKGIQKLGRPQRFTPDELYEKAEEYFKKCDDTIVSTDNKTWLVTRKPKTITGLCLYLGIHKDYILELKDRPEFLYVTKFIRQTVENYLEENMLSGSTVSSTSIFSLKNHFGWVDKQEVESKNDNTITIKFSE